MGQASEWITADLAARLRAFQAGDALLSVLTGAGISAASGIPTFRGEEGYWVVGSRNYQPREISTLSMFQERPLEVWKWFLFRRTMSTDARPNEGHHAIVELERIFGDRFRLITQNVDGLHQAAGSSEDRLLSIHGDLRHTRCGDLCTSDLYEFPDIPKQRGEDLTPAEIERLKCPACGEFLR
ncbi:MAG: Sir2 family NAD-dependent protein deacetylase, partial [Leptospirales bacterium]